MRLVALLALLPSAAFALTEEECSALHPEIVSAVEMADCTAETDALEAELAASLLALGAIVPQDLRAGQEAAQSAWAAWREAECAFQAAPYPGSGGTGVMIQCRAELARARIEQLQSEAEVFAP